MLWKKTIDNKNNTWLQIVQIPTIMKYGNTYLHKAARTGQTKMFEIIMEEYELKNPQNLRDVTLFHLACEFGHYKIADMLVQKSAQFNIDLHAENNDGKIALELARGKPVLELIEMMYDDNDLPKKKRKM